MDQYNRRFYRRKRSELKKALRNGKIIPRSLRRSFNINLKKHSVYTPYFDFKELKKKKIEELVPSIEIKIPKILCLIKNSNETINFLNKLQSEITNYRNIFIDHENTEYLGLAASHIFDSIITEHRLNLKKSNQQLYLSGRTSRRKHINNFLLAIGFFNKIDLPLHQVQSGVDLDYANKYASFYTKGNKEYIHLKGNAATGLTQYLNRCLNHTGKKLTMNGIGKLADAIGELVGNAEEHIVEVKDWHVVGCYEKETSTLQFAIINSGPSIYETLSSSESTALKGVEEIKENVAAHRSLIEKFSDYFTQNPKWEELMWTVMALQEGISSKRYDNVIDAKNRGQGLMDFLEFIKEASTTSQERVICILSGYSHIKIDFIKYDISKKLILNSATSQSEIRRRICFNDENDLKKPQDNNYVSELSQKFEGTIITGIFKIKEHYIQNEQGN